MVETNELDRILELLESFPDEELSVKLLKEFSEKNKNFGKILLNHDSDLPHAEWKRKCDEAKKDMDDFLVKIEKYSDL